MSVGPLGGIAGSAAGSPLAQTKGPEMERLQQDAGSQEARVQNQSKAEAASGIGEADGQDHETADRDADGRSPWKIPARKAGDPGPAADEAQSKDPTGESGNLLDLSG